MMTATRHVSIVVLAGALAACQAVPAPEPRATTPALGPAVAARQAVAARDCPRAIPLLRQALALSPRDLTLHYELAVCFTYVEAPDDARREFAWVLANAPPRSEEARMARDWVRATVPEAPVVEGADAQEPPKGVGRLAGRAVWADPGEAPAPFRLRLYLIGLSDTPSQGRFYNVLPDADGRYEFKDVPAGPYRLTDRPSGRTLWRLRVTILPAGDTVVNLTPENSVASRDDFRESSG